MTQPESLTVWTMFVATRLQGRLPLQHDIREQFDSWEEKDFFRFEWWVPIMDNSNVNLDSSMMEQVEYLTGQTP